VKLDKFVLALLAGIFIAYIFPWPATGHSGVILGHLSTIGISLIFFFYGLRLSPEKIRLGLKNWKLHFLVQSSTYLFFPLAVLMLYPFIQTERHEILWLGLFFLAVVPSTVSTSVIMVSIGKGNIPAAIFNASISGIIGIVLTPLLTGFFLQQTRIDFDFTEIYIRLLTGIILPVIIGIMLRRKLHGFTLKFGKSMGWFDKAVILLIVYRSFANSFNDSVFSIVSPADLIILFFIVIALFFLIYGLIYLFSGILGFSREDKVTALFCGSQKSLVHGTVFSSVLFGSFFVAGVILLPLMLFHAFQIFILSMIAVRYGKIN
jgi:solute carrier family 10 (sodium/bile acid cotransporter), member 7